MKLTELLALASPEVRDLVDAELSTVMDGVALLRVKGTIALRLDVTPQGDARDRGVDVKWTVTAKPPVALPTTRAFVGPEAETVSPRNPRQPLQLDIEEMAK